MAAVWSDERVDFLISILKEKNIIHQLDTSKRNASIYRKISVELQNAFGVTYTEAQLRTKVKNLKVLWKSIRDNNNKSGRNRENCLYFNQLDELWGNRPPARPICIIESLDTDATTDSKVADLLQLSLPWVVDNSSDDGDDDDTENSDGLQSNMPLMESPNLADDGKNGSSSMSGGIQSIDEGWNSGFVSGNEEEEMAAATSFSKSDAKTTLGRKRKAPKSEILTCELMRKFKEINEKNLASFAEVEKRSRDEFLQRLFEHDMKMETDRRVFEEKKIERREAHELKIMKLLSEK